MENWSFDIYLVFTTWAGCHYALAIALFPYSGLGTEIQVKGWTPRPFLGVFLVLSLLDFAQTALRGELYAAVFYVPFTPALRCPGRWGSGAKQGEGIPVSGLVHDDLAVLVGHNRKTLHWIVPMVWYRSSV